MSEIRNRRSRRSRRLETPCPERKKEATQVETPITGNGTLTNNNNVVQESLGKNNSENQLIQSTLISNKIQAWTQIMEQKTSDRIEKLREEMDNKLEVVLKKIKSNKTPAKHRDIFRPVRLHQLSRSCFGTGKKD